MTYFVTSVAMPDQHSSDMRYTRYMMPALRLALACLLANYEFHSSTIY